MPVNSLDTRVTPRNQTADRMPRMTVTTPDEEPDAPRDQEGGDRQQVGPHDVTAAAQLDRVGVAEQRRAPGQAAGPPVAEDHRREADVPAAGHLTLPVEVRGDQDEEAAREPGEAAGDEDRHELVADHVDTQRLRGMRGLTAGPEPQPE